MTAEVLKGPYGPSVPGLGGSLVWDSVPWIKGMVLNKYICIFRRMGSRQALSPEKTGGKICDFLKSGGRAKQQFLKSGVGQLPRILLGCDPPILKKFKFIWKNSL